MIRIRNLAAACAVALGVASMSATVLLPSAAQAQQFSAEVGKPLQAAQTAIKGKQWNVALDRLKEAQAVGNKKPHEQYAIDQLLAYVLYQQKKFGELVGVYERMINSGQMPANEVPERMKTVAQIHFQQKNYAQAINWSKKALEKNPNQQDVLLILGQSHYLTKDYKSTVDVMGRMVSNAERAGRKPDEQWLRFLQASNKELNDRDAMTEVLRKLVRHYQKPEDWDALLNAYSKKQNSDRVTLGYYRLMLDADVLKDPGDWVETAQLAMDDNVPAEAQRVVEQGIEKGILKSTDKATQGRYDRLLEGTKQRAAQSKAALDQLVKDAAASQQGDKDIELGKVYMSLGQYDQAIAALQTGIKKGGLSDANEAQIVLGRAFLKKGQKDQARQAFRAVKKESEWADLAELWTLRIA